MRSGREVPEALGYTVVAVTVTAVGIAAGALGGRPLVGLGVGAVGALGCLVVLRVLSDRQLAGLTTRIERLRTASGSGHGRAEVTGWEGIATELDAAAARLEDRLAALDADRERMLALLEGLPPAILIFSDDGLSYANQAARTAFRLEPEQVGGDERLSPMQAVGMQTLADAVERTRRDGIDAEAEARREGRSYFARTSLTVLGEVALVLTDLTEARRLDAVRRDFVTNASHELKTPVAGIQALAESLELAIARDPERARRMIGRIRSEAQRLATLVRELLDLARVEELTRPVASTTVDLGGIARTQVARHRTAARDLGVRLSVRTGEGCLVQASPEDTRLVIDNLVRNAIHYNHADGTVDVRVEIVDGRVVLEVADTGIGIPAADRERVFERFYRVDKARSRAVGGTGLGLSLVRHAAQRMGGDVSLSSALGTGSTFRVELPRAELEEEAETDGERPKDPGRPTRR